MAIPLAVPIVGGLLVATGVTLRVLKTAKDKKAALPAGTSAPAVAPRVPSAAPRGAAPVVPVIQPATTVAQAAALAKGLPLPPAVPGAPTMADLQASLADPANNQVSFDGISDEELNAAQDAFNRQKAGVISPSGGGAVVGQMAIVTTNDQPPLGDLKILDRPNGTQIGGAEKNGTVVILESFDPVFAQISWAGGSRLPAATGFAKKAFLKLI